MTLALTGATGFVGQMLLDVLAQGGTPVRALTRRASPARGAVTWVRGDLADRGALADLVRDTEAVVHVAGVVNAPDAAGFEAGNVTGTLNLVQAAAAAGVGRVLHVSSLAAREPALSLYGASKRRGERIVAASGLDWTIVRPPAVYGPRDRDMLDLFRAAKWGVVPMPPPGRSDVIHVRDLADLLVALLPGGEGVSHAVFEPSDGREGGWSHRELAVAIGWAVGRKVRVPQLSAKAMGRAAAMDRFLRGTHAKLTADRVAYMTHPNWTHDPRAAVPRKVWQPQILTPDGLKATAAWYRAEGWL